MVGLSKKVRIGGDVYLFGEALGSVRCEVPGGTNQGTRPFAWAPLLVGDSSTDP